MRYTWRGLLLVLALAPALCAASQPAVAVGPAGEVSVEATLAPIGDVLARFARATGAALTWDGTEPRQLVTLRVQAPNAAAALAAIVEGQALNYAVALDATGSRVATLIVGSPAAPSRPSAGRPASGGASSNPVAPRSDPRRPPPQRDAEPESEPEAEADPPVEEPAAAPEASAPDNGSGNRQSGERGNVPPPEATPTPLPFGPVPPQRYPTSPFNPQAGPTPLRFPSNPSPTPAPTPED